MKRQRLTYRPVVLSCLLWLVMIAAACTTDADQLLTESGEPMRLYTAVTGREGSDASAGRGEDLRARLLFWTIDEYHKHNTSPGELWAVPFLNIIPTQEIDYYQVDNRIPFDTRHSYPPGNQKVHATGYAPSELTSNDNYKTLLIPDSLRNGKTDFLSGDGNAHRVGSSTDPFETIPDEESTTPGIQQDAMLKQKQLEFCHLTAKILVLAQRHESMAQRIGVKNVSVKLYGQQVPTELTWQPQTPSATEGNAPQQEIGGYYPTKPTSKEIALKRTTNDPIVLGQLQRVDSCYVYAGNDTHSHEEGAETGNTADGSGTITLSMDVTAELMPFNTTTGTWADDQTESRTWENVEVKIESKTGNQLKMGYVYRIIIIFNPYDIRLQGIEMNWESGGLHYVPITPVENN